jgi:3-hydroxybutyryl-CoA dehydrogenase
MPMKKIAVIGAGTMGAQIAVQIANHGYEVSLMARHPERFQKSLRDLVDSLRNTGRISAPALEEWLQGAGKVEVGKDLAKALREADLVVEAVAEDLEMKRTLFARIDSLAPPDAILSTTSSTVPVSRIEDATRRPARCLNLHFYQPALIVNLV